MTEKKIYIPQEKINQLIPPMGGCYASDKITVDGLLIKYMYREEPTFENDSGWRFFSGTETQEYVDDPNNLMIYEVNTIANYDQSIIPYLDMPLGAELERLNNNTFAVLN
jgi:hypothetical protein